ncbi:odorant receptor 22c-like [Wyeomyia smithii]|uniref:odorant receptor 22c-like n=1 Tax=Wyeomyia smithii TaxID=174621 RepID=UPI002467B9BD|nr:odorant receptor 22c-like [Wyeomyia smithii]
MIPVFITCVKYAVDAVVPPLTLSVEADFVLFDHTSSFWVWLPTALVSSMEMLLLTLMACVQDSFNWCMVYQVSRLFSIIRMKASRLDELLESEIFGEKLEEIVRMQDVAYRSAKQLKKVLSPLLLLLYGTCVVSLCMTMMVLTIARGDRQLLTNMIILVWYIFFQIFSYSVLGTELMNASTSVADAVYRIHWYKRRIAEQRLLLIVMMRSQRGASLTATDFFIVNRASFGMALRSAFSYFTVLRQFYASK